MSYTRSTVKLPVAPANRPVPPVTVACSTMSSTPNQTLESVFNVPDRLGLDNTTLLQALQSGGGPGVKGAAQTVLGCFCRVALRNER